MSRAVAKKNPTDFKNQTGVEFRSAVTVEPELFEMTGYLKYKICFFGYGH
jgi:hypothetical protein